MIMIDWLSIIVPYDGPEIGGGRTVVLDDSGVILFEKLHPLAVEGSFSNKVTVKSLPAYSVENRKPLHMANPEKYLPGAYYGEEEKQVPGAMVKGGLYISGNPAKFFQGHNLFGSGRVFPLVYDFVRAVTAAVGVVSVPMMRAVREGNFYLTRIDLTASFELENIFQVRTWLKSATAYASGKNQKISDYDGKTLYMGEYSRRKTVKLYCKADDLKAHPLSLKLSKEQTIFLTKWAQNKLRAEVTLRNMALRDMGMRHGSAWQLEGIESMIYGREIGNLKLSGDYNLTEEEIDLMPKRYRAAFQLYLQGFDLAEMYSRNTYYKYKKYFFEEYQVNISLPVVEKKKTNVVPLMRVLEARPAIIPEEAFAFGLVHGQN